MAEDEYQKQIFTLRNGTEITVLVDERGRLKVSCYDGPIYIEPTADNAVYVVPRNTK